MTRPNQHEKPAATPSQPRPGEHEDAKPSLQHDIRARTMRPHKGDVGRPGTNEEIFQGSKEKELR